MDKSYATRLLHRDLTDRVGQFSMSEIDFVRYLLDPRSSGRHTTKLVNLATGVQNAAKI